MRERPYGWRWPPVGRGVRAAAGVGFAAFVGFAAAAAATAAAQAQSYPDKPIRLIVPAAPGGPTDIPARLLSQILPKLGQPAVIENRAGAGGAIAARAVVGAAPDGYTLLVGNTSVLAVAPAVSAGAGYDPDQAAGCGRQGVGELSDPGGASGFRGEVGARAHRLGEEPAGRAQLRAHRRRRAAAHDRGAVQVGRGRGHRGRALQERRRVGHRRTRADKSR